jgi:hypothetical protein
MWDTIRGKASSEVMAKLCPDKLYVTTESIRRICKAGHPMDEGAVIFGHTRIIVKVRIGIDTYPYRLIIIYSFEPLILQ